MEDHRLIAFEEMADRLKQHEEIIIQLLEIIAATNRRVSDLSNHQKLVKYHIK